MTRKKIPQDPILTTVESLSHDGRGIAHIDGKTTFIRGTLPSEKVLFKYTKKRSKFDEGEVIEVIEKSEYRVEPQCKHFGICGACQMQHLETSQQILHKQNTLLNHLQHIGNVVPEEILPPIIGPTYGYRRKARLGVRYVNKKSRVLVGFRETNGCYIADIHQCEVLHPSVGLKLIALQQLIQSLDNFRAIPQIEVSVGDDATALIFRHLEPLSTKDLESLAQFCQKENFHCYLQPGNIDSIHKIWPENSSSDRLQYQLVDQNAEFLFHPADFTQVNNEINQQMVTKAIELLEPDENDFILDLFCGLGNFTIPLASHCKEIVGIEGDQKMVIRASENTALNQIENAKFFQADLTQDVAEHPFFNMPFNKLLLDPPRSGALEVLSQLARHNIQRIVYVSCNTATLARDAGELVHQQGFKLKKVGVMDMFPHTSHVETIALFEKS